MWAQILCYKNQRIHWYHCNPTFLWQINFTLVWRLISALIWDISGLWNRSDGRDYREKRIVISRFLTPYMHLYQLVKSVLHVLTVELGKTLTNLPGYRHSLNINHRTLFNVLCKCIFNFEFIEENGN